MTTIRAAAVVDVYKGAERVAELTRTDHGASLRYLTEWVARARDLPHAAIAFGLPVRADPYPVFGTNLHPFFAGLLPEGLRLRALVRALKTSEDDLFSLLLASGADTVGDVSVAAPGSTPEEHAPIADIPALASVSFDALFDESLRYERAQPEATFAGVQPKLSAAMISLPLRARHKRKAYILKLTPPEFPRLAENEAFFMALARRAGFEVAHVELVHDRAGRSGLLVERFDRRAHAAGEFERVHQEDACQLLDRYPADKYRLTLADVADALAVCSAPLPERLKLLRLQAFSYLIANGDLHAKNVSIRVLDGQVGLTPAYDLLSTLPYGDQNMALAMEGRDSALKAAHFCAFGERVGVRREAVLQMLKVLVKRVAAGLPELARIGLAQKKTTHLERVMRERLRDLEP